jgi:hypothetical protein
VEKRRRESRGRRREGRGREGKGPREARAVQEEPGTHKGHADLCGRRLGAITWEAASACPSTWPRTREDRRRASSAGGAGWDGMGRPDGGRANQATIQIPCFGTHPHPPYAPRPTISASCRVQRRILSRIGQVVRKKLNGSVRGRPRLPSEAGGPRARDVCECGKQRGGGVRVARGVSGVRCWQRPPFLLLCCSSALHCGLSGVSG